MLQLADCGLEDIKALRACNRLWEGIPLDYSQGEESVFLLVSRSGDLLKGHRMAVLLYCCTVYNQGGVRRLIHVQSYETNKVGRQPFFKLLLCAPPKVLDNLSYTCPLLQIANCPASSSSLDLFNLGNIFLMVWVPDS